MNKLIILILALFLLNNCSFKENSQIWKKEKKNLNEKDNIRAVFAKDIKTLSELNTGLELNLPNIITDTKVAYNKNNYGAQSYEGILNKVGNYKFSKLDDVDQLNFKPIFLKNGLIFFDKKGSIIKYDNNQKIIWKNNYYSKSEKKLKPKIYFAIDGKNLLVADSIAKFYSININSGDLNWVNNNTYSFNSSIKKSKNKIFIVDYKNTLRCYNIKDGSECWNLQTEESFTMSNSKYSIIIIGDLVIFSNSIGDITAVNIETGLIAWQLPTQGSTLINETYNFKISKLVADNNSIFFSNNRNEFYSIDIKTGTVNWINKINSNITPIIIENLLFSVSNEGYLYTIDKNKGNIIKINDLYKNYKIKKKKDIHPIGFIIGKKNLYLTSSDGKMIVADLKIGNILNTIKISSTSVSEPFIFNENLFIIRNGSIIQYN